MALQSETIHIDGTTYRVTQMPYGKGQKWLIRLYKVLGPALGEGLAKLPTDVKTWASRDVGEFLPGLASIITALADRMSEDDYADLVMALAKHTDFRNEGQDQFVGLEPQIELHFAGRYWQQMQWLGFALKVNYASFLGVRDWLGALSAPLAASQSRRKSTGQSIE